MKPKINKISFNSPVILIFAIICLAAFALNYLTGGYSNRLLFSVYRAPLSDPLTYVRFVGHIFGHADWGHISANMTMLLLTGPLLEEKYGMSAEVIDARSLVPFNYEKVLASVKKTGRIIIAGDATSRGSFLNDLARNITELAFDELDAPPVVLGSRDWITPAFELEYAFFPQVDSFIDAIHEKIVPLKGHVPTRNFTEAEQIRRAKAGI